MGGLENGRVHLAGQPLFVNGPDIQPLAFHLGDDTWVNIFVGQKWVSKQVQLAISAVSSVSRLRDSAAKRKASSSDSGVN